MIDVIFDMETQDPDDVIALCFLADHPSVNLRAVTVTPGSRMQVALVREVLKHTKVWDTIPIGSRAPDHPKECVSAFHWKVVERPAPSAPDGYGHEILFDTITKYPDATIVTGAPLTNLRHLLEFHPAARIKRWFGQGGYIGCNVQPNEEELKRFSGRLPFLGGLSSLEKFAGKEFVNTFNFGGDRKAAELLLTDPRVEMRCLVGKNVCHGLAYDGSTHHRLLKYSEPGVTQGLRFIWQLMNVYLQKNPFKMLHDPLAAVAAVHPDVCKFVEVRYKRNRQNQWGADLADGTNTWGAVAVDADMFFLTFVGAV